MSIRAKVSSGRIIVDQPTLLPEGTTLDLVVDDEGDDLDDEEREALNAHLAPAGTAPRPATSVRPASYWPSFAASADEAPPRRHDPEADEDATRIDQWWTRNRGAAPTLFFEEFGGRACAA